MRSTTFKAKAGTYHFLEDMEEPLFEGELPFRYIRNPFIPMTFNENMTDLGGLVGCQVVQSLQERLNEIDTLELWHAHTSTPVMLVNTALADNPEAIMTALQDANQPGSHVSIQGKANAPLGDIIGQTPIPSFSPRFQTCARDAIKSLSLSSASLSIVGGLWVWRTLLRRSRLPTLRPEQETDEE
jgi:hypothetical protein